MIVESGWVVGIEPEGLWVETIQRSACGSCQAKQGCGNHLMQKSLSGSSYLWVLLEGRDSKAYAIGDKVQLGIPEDVIAKGSLLIYCVPLLGLLAATILAHQWQLSEGLSMLSALVGLLVGGLIVRWRSSQTRLDTRVHPVLIDHQNSTEAVTICSLD